MTLIVLSPVAFEPTISLSADSSRTSSERVLIGLQRVQIAHYCVQTKRDGAGNNAPPCCDRAIGEKARPMHQFGGPIISRVARINLFGRISGLRGHLGAADQAPETE
jgi:hypothetical protein